MTYERNQRLPDQSDRIIPGLDARPTTAMAGDVADAASGSLLVSHQPQKYNSVAGDEKVGRPLTQSRQVGVCVDAGRLDLKRWVAFLPAFEIII